MKKELLSLKHNQLLTHKKNMRRFYPSENVREMADSIYAAKGVIEPLIVVKDQGSNKYIVVDGNMRLAGARLLGEKCPRLDCKEVFQSEGDQLLSMITANQIRYDVDPVSEALHYKSLKDEGLSVRDISKLTGVYEIRITNRIILAKLDEDIQNLIVEKKLPADPKVARALLNLNKTVRIKIATRLADNPNTKTSTILNACDRLSNNKKPVKKMGRPAAELSGADNATKVPVTAKCVRDAARKMCGQCNQVENKLRDKEEPAWAMVVHEADKNCKNCDLKEMQEVCRLCPAVSFLKNLIKIGSVDGK